MSRIVRTGRPLPPELIEKILDTVRRMLAEPVVTVHLARGIKFIDNYTTGYREGHPTDGETLTIEVNGGAHEIEETVEEKLARLQKEETP